jgi:hypothetical protein
MKTFIRVLSRFLRVNQIPTLLVHSPEHRLTPNPEQEHWGAEGQKRPEEQSEIGFLCPSGRCLFLCTLTFSRIWYCTEGMENTGRNRSSLFLRVLRLRLQSKSGCTDEPRESA